MSFSGNILTMPFADLLQWVAQSRKTGTLVVKGRDHTKKIYFSDGLVVAAASENPREFLSYYLVGWSYIAEDELQELLQMQNRHGTLLGELLVIIGRISRDELAYVLEVKTENAVYDIFEWQEGEFRFLENILPDKKFQPTELPIDMLILEGIRRKDEWTKMREMVADGSWVPRLLRAVDLKDMEEPDLSIIREINGSRSLEKIALNSRTGLFTVVEYVVQGIEAGVFAADPPEATKSEIPGYSGGAWKLVLRKATDLLEVDDLQASYDQLRKLRSQFPSDQDVLKQVATVEGRIRDCLSAKGIKGKVVPELAISMSELTKISCSPEEGFLLSRVNGTYPIDELCKMMPGAELEVYLMVDAMVRREVLRFKGE